jgi:phosphopantothenoylcysteine decarboxylase/phosphopantothenate--cysteine ligase
MTRNAREFITPLTFAALSGHKVITDLFGEAQGSSNFENAIEHIAVAQSIDALVIAPATANVLAKKAHGIADDFLTTLCLATKAPLIVAPAMHVNMWEHSATQQNLDTLRARGVRVVSPDEGYLACGMTGAGRLVSPECIAQTVFNTLGLREDLKGETVLVTAGPTQEPLDDVRYISNRSSGKMGYALAEASRRRGARVLLVSGPTRIEPPAVSVLETVRTAKEMAEAVARHAETATVVVMAAAVADFRPAIAHAGKIKKRQGVPTVKLEPTTDILSEISGRRRDGQIIVGFAAETDHLIENAAAKLRAKRLDLLVANDVSQNGAGFDVDTNIVTLLFPDGHNLPLEKMSKLEVANRVLDEVVEMRRKSEVRSPTSEVKSKK